jgi:hypothetical protein
MRSIDFIIDLSNLDIFGTIWNNVDMSLFLDIFKYPRYF